MSYRLAMGLGSTSLGWAMVRLNAAKEPCAIIKTGVRIFSNGREPARLGEIGHSLAASRREARAMRRRRDRLLKRKARMLRTLVAHGFFPSHEGERKALEKLEPLALRAKGLDHALTPPEFARALFHLNQRRGFKSNRKTDKKDDDSSTLKVAINQLRQAMVQTGCRTVGEWLYARHQQGLSIRARYRESRVLKDDGKTKIEKSYDLYIDRAMIEAEFDAIWSKQAELHPELFHETARSELKDCLLYQRPLKPFKPGRCMLMPDLERAPLALPSQQRFKIYQEINHLRLLQDDLGDEPLTLAQRDLLAQVLEFKHRINFAQVRKLLAVSGRFNLEDEQRIELKGNATSAILSRKEMFAGQWANFSENLQDAIVMQLLTEENETRLMNWLREHTGVDEATAERIVNVQLPEGYGRFSAKALERVLPELRRDVVSLDQAVWAAGFESHNHIHDGTSGEILPELPYYGQYLQRHIGFGSGKPEDPPEKRFGRIANPTVHIGLNQMRTVVNALIKRYGHPSEVIVEVARDLKLSHAQRKENQKRQTDNHRRSERLRRQIADFLGTSPEQVRSADLQKMVLWEELGTNVAERSCPYSGVLITAQMLFSDQIGIEHILPFPRTLDDSLNNKTVAMRQAIRVKGQRTPWEAKDDLAAQGWATADMLARVEKMSKNKRYRFYENGYAKWLREEKGFLAKALSDNHYLSRIAREYLSLICPQSTRAIPGQMTAMLRAKLGLNGILGLSGEKNRNDHRHHAVDACVIAVTDAGMLQRLARASACECAPQQGVDPVPLPWATYCEHVQRAVDSIWVSHKPDHGHEGAMHNDTAYGLLDDDCVRVRKVVDGLRVREKSKLKVIALTHAKANARHGLLSNAEPKPYKGYKGDSNYCIEIVRNEKGKWEGEVISTYEAYQLERQGGLQRLRHPMLSCSGKPLVMRLIRNDIVRLQLGGQQLTLRLCKMSGEGVLAFADVAQSNVDARVRAKEMAYIFKTARSLQKAEGRRVTISPVGELRDPGFYG